MEYIRGLLFTQKFQTISKYEIDTYVGILSNFLKTQKNTATEIYTEIELKNCIDTKLSALYTGSKYKDLIQFIRKYTSDITIGKVERGLCHGDLTFSNILFTNDSLCFLDFLDSYIESYIIDIVKLKQDLYYNWNLHLLNVESVYRTRAQQIFSYICNVLIVFFN